MSKTFDLKYLVIAVITLALGACAHTGDQAKLSAPEQVQDQDPYLNMVCARYAQLNKEWDKALRLYTGVDDPLARLEEARICFILDNNQAAMDKLDVLIEKKDYLDEALGLRMKIYAKMHQWNMALNDAQALLEENPDNPDLKLFIARLRIITADYAGARDLLEKIPTDRKTTMIYYALSKACVGEKSFLCAQKALEAIVSSDRTYKPAYVDLGAIYKMFGQDCKAEEIYERLVDIDPFSIPAHSGLAEIYIRHKRYNDAICHLKSLWDIQGDRQSLEQLVILDLREKRYTETIDLIHSLDTLGKNDRYYLAMAYAGLKQWDNALGILEELGNGCKIVLLKASILEDMGRREDAIGMLEAAWQTNKVNNGCNDLGYQMCMVMERANRQKDALVHSLDMLRDRPNDPVLLNFTGYVWAEMGVNLDQAHTMIAKALKIKPNDAYILDSMAWVLYRQDRSEEALVYMKKALSGIDDDPVMNEHMGDILLDTGKDKDAFAYYLKARILSDRIFSGKDKASLDSKIDILFEGLKQK